MSNNPKKTVKKQEQKVFEQQKMQEQQVKQQQRRVKSERLKQLAQKSAPLAEYGLLDSYEFFLAQLAASGLPQGNIFEFAAQTILKFQKNKIKKEQKLREVSKANEQAVKIVSQSIKTKERPKVKKQYKPQMLPFKGQLDQKQMQLMGIK